MPAMNISSTLLTAGLMLCLAGAAPAQIPKLADMPPRLTEASLAELTKTRAVLVERRDDFQARGRAFSAKCGNVTVGSALEAECEREHKQLEADRARYIKMANDFNASMIKAVAAAPYYKAVGQLSGVEGKVEIITPDGRTLTGASLKGVQFSYGMRVVTGPDGKATVRFGDSTRTELGKNTEFSVGEVDDLAQVLQDLDREIRRKDPDAFVVTLKKGVCNWVSRVEQLANRSGRYVRTPTAVCGVRGTEFETVVADDGSGHFKLFSGQIEITKRKDGAKFLMEANQMVTFDANGEFTPPRPIR